MLAYKQDRKDGPELFQPQAVEPLQFIVDFASVSNIEQDQVASSMLPTVLASIESLKVIVSTLIAGSEHDSVVVDTIASLSLQLVREKFGARPGINT